MNFNDIVRHCLLKAGISTSYGKIKRLSLEADSRYGVIGAFEQKQSAPHRNHLILQLLRIMRLTAFILLAACLQVAANGRAQTVTLSVKNAPIQKVFREIIRQTGVSIIYDETTFDNFAPVTLNVKDAPVQQVLDQCFKDKLFKVTFEKNTITIVSARSYSQTVSFSGKDVPLQTVLASIEKQTGLSFFFNYTMIKDTKPVTLDVHDAALDYVLSVVLRGQGLDFYKEGKTVFIVKKKEVATSAAVERTPPSENGVTIRGRVVNHEGVGLEGATVMVKHTSKGAVTDGKGMFEIRNVLENAVLEVSYTGYQNREISVQSKDIVSIEMALSSSTLDETQVIAYGSTTQRMTAGNISSVKADAIAEQPVNNPLLALEGRVPGLVVTQANGIAGSGVTLRVEGYNSIAKGNDPFYVVDGVPYQSQLLPNIGNVLGSTNVGSGYPAFGIQNGNPMNYINPQDIESITILKDADATAIYGSRAANGAILITTKKGKVGETKVELNGQYGVGQVSHFLPVLNTAHYLEMRDEAFRNDNLSPNPKADYDLTLWDTTRNTNWQKKLIGGTAHYMDDEANVSGGTDNTQFLIGSDYHRETTVFPGDFSDQKGSVHFNINNVSSNRRFHLQFTGNYMVDMNQLPNNDLTGSAIKLAPDAPPLYNADHTLNWAPNTAGVSTFSKNPLAPLNNVYQNKTNNLISNVILSYEIFPGLLLKSSFGYTNQQVNETLINPLTSVVPENRATTRRSATYNNSNLNSWIIEPQLDFRKTISRGKLDILAGTTIQQNNSNQASMTGLGYTSDLILYNVNAAANINPGTSLISVYKYNALFGKINYIWSDKYIVDLAARRDGSSRFGSNNEFHNFGSAALAWIFSEENFVKDKFRFFSFGKVRASYGTTGNDQIGDYQFLYLYNPVTTTLSYENGNGLMPAGLPNPNLQWELSKKAQVGLDLGFLHDRILIDGTYYRNRSSNELITYLLPITTGSNGVTANFPATVQNDGFEVSINSGNIQSKAFNWSTSANISIPRNKLVAFPNIATSSYNSLFVVGKPITITKVYKLLGVNDTTGEYQFSTAKGTPTYNPVNGTDNFVAINTSPKYYGGLQNSFRYRGIQVDILFQFAKQTGLNYAHGSLPGLYNGGLGNQPVYVLNRWQKPGDIQSVERYTTTTKLLTQQSDAESQSTGVYGDASYIRLKNVSLAYQFPTSWQKKMHLKNCRIFINGQNLFTITKFKGIDPENESTSMLPPLRVIVAGAHIEL